MRITLCKLVDGILDPYTLSTKLRIYDVHVQSVLIECMQLYLLTIEIEIYPYTYFVATDNQAKK